MAYARPSATNGYLTNWAATGQMIAFMREKSRFKLTEYVQFVPSKTTVAPYTKIDPAEMHRIPGGDPKYYAWPHNGAPRPKGRDELIGFEIFAARCQRYNIPCTLPGGIERNHSWGVKQTHLQTRINKAMLVKALRIHSVLQTAGNWSGNTGVANTINGGFGRPDVGSSDPASANFLAFKRTIDAAAAAIYLATYGTVRQEDLVLVMSKVQAQIISATSEIQKPFHNSVFSKDNATGDMWGTPNEYGIPSRYSGVKIVVEDTYYETANQGATSAPTAVMNNDEMYLLARPGGLFAPYAVDSGNEADTPANFSTCQVFYVDQSEGKKDEGDGSGLLTIEEYPDPEEDETRMHAKFEDVPVLVAPISGYRITDVLASV